MPNIGRMGKAHPEPNLIIPSVVIINDETYPTRPQAESREEGSRRNPRPAGRALVISRPVIIQNCRMGSTAERSILSRASRIPLVMVTMVKRRAQSALAWKVIKLYHCTSVAVPEPQISSVQHASPI